MWKSLNVVILGRFPFVRTGPLDQSEKQMKLAISTRFLLKNVFLHAYYLGFD